MGQLVGLPEASRPRFRFARERNRKWVRGSAQRADTNPAATTLRDNYPPSANAFSTMTPKFALVNLKCEQCACVEEIFITRCRSMHFEIAISNETGCRNRHECRSLHPRGTGGRTELNCLTGPNEECGRHRQSRTEWLAHSFATKLDRQNRRADPWNFCGRTQPEVTFQRTRT